MVLQWLASRTVRTATELRRQVARLLNEQRDLLQPEVIQKITAAMDELNVSVRNQTEKAEIKRLMEQLIAVAEANLIPYPNSSIRENIKELFVAATVILAFTTFFLQLTKIPTGSLQPTLFGITEVDFRGNPNAETPGWLARFGQFWLRGVSYVHVKAKADGELTEVQAERTVFPFVKMQRFRIGKEWYTVWFPPDQLIERAGLHAGQYFRRGEDIINLKVISGDHLLVDRISFNFRRPRRGEIIVFKTRGIRKLPEDQLYIKRLVGLGGEHVRIGDDQHLIIDGRRLDAATPRFENVYTFEPVPRLNHYFGHVNQKVANRLGFYSNLAPLFRDEKQEHVVAPGHYLAMGDNTLNSRDSREWGDLPQENVIGKCWFVYWPFTERFGWGYR